jgi:O-glycosyl hydrolase
MKKLVLPILIFFLSVSHAQNYGSFKQYANINFEDGTSNDNLGNAVTVLQNGATVVTDVDRGSKVVQYTADSKGNLKFISSPLKDSMTIAFWFKREVVDPTECWRMMFAFYATDGSNVYFSPKTTWGDGAYFVYDNKPFTIYQSVAANTVINNVWTHYAIVFAGNVIKIYQEGAFVASTTMLTKLSDINATKWYFGCNPDLSYPMTGKMDDVKIFHSALASNQIKAIYDNKTIPNAADDVLPYIHLPLDVDTKDIKGSITTTPTNISFITDLKKGKVAAIENNGRISFDSNPFGTYKSSTAFMLKKESFSVADSGKFILKNKAANGDFIGLQVNYSNGNTTLQLVNSFNNTKSVLATSGTKTVTPNSWNSIVFVQTYTTAGNPAVRLYINGNQAFAKAGVDLQTYNLNAWYLGSDGADNLETKVDELEIFLREISAAEVSNYNSSQTTTVEIKADITAKNQTIRNFGASDGWNTQFVGLYFNGTQKEKLAELLFSTDKNTDGSPKGIGLSAWRFNIGAGTSEQGTASRITAPERRSECFLNSDGTYNWNKQIGQQWFLNKAALTYNVPDIIGWQNSPPVQYTVRGLGFREYGDPKQSILKTGSYSDYGKFLSNVILHFKQTGVNINYVSPLNEPQWDWMPSASGADAGQEGSPWTNQEISNVVKAIGTEFNNQNITSKIFVSEAGNIGCLLSGTGVAYNQLSDLWDKTSSLNITNVASLSNVVSSHSYGTDISASSLVSNRQTLKDRLTALNSNLEYWQTEYSLLGTGYQFGQATGRNLTPMECAISLARVIHSDLVTANATGWQWWTTFEFEKNLSPEERYSLIRVALNTTNTAGLYRPTKLLYTLGNYSHFIRPGMKRLDISRSDNLAEIDAIANLMVSAYLNESTNEVVYVVINPTSTEKGIKLTVDKLLPNTNVSEFIPYITTNNDNDNLKRYPVFAATDRYILPATSVVTFVGKINQGTSTPTITNQIQEFIIFPNPARNNVQIKLSNKLYDNLIRITDISGKQILNKKINKSESNISIDISSLRKGLYFISVDNLSGKQTQKLMVE